MRNSAQYDLDRMRFENQNFPRGQAHRPLYSIFFSNFNPTPLTEKLDPPLLGHLFLWGEFVYTSE